MEGLEVIPTTLSILVVLAVLGVTLWALRWVGSMRFGGTTKDRRGAQRVRVVERHAMGRNGAIVVLRYGGREHLIGVTESSMTHIAEGAIELDDETGVIETDSRPKTTHNPLTRGLDTLREKTVRR